MKWELLKPSSRASLALLVILQLLSACRSSKPGDMGRSDVTIDGSDAQLADRLRDDVRFTTNGENRSKFLDAQTYVSGGWKAHVQNWRLIVQRVLARTPPEREKVTKTGQDLLQIFDNLDRDLLRPHYVPAGGGDGQLSRTVEDFVEAVDP